MSILSGIHDGRDVRRRPHRRVVLDTLDTLGPHEVDGATIQLRRARITDGPAWRTARLRNASRLRPAFGDDIALTDWVDHVLADREAMRQGGREPLLTVGDEGQVLGECTFDLDGRSGLAECSMWTVSEVTRTQAVWIIASASLWLLECRPSIPWIVAPVAVSNPGPARMLTASGFEQVAVARQLRLYDDVPTDHDIWRLENTAAQRDRLRALTTAL